MKRQALILIFSLLLALLCGCSESLQPTENVIWYPTGTLVPDETISEPLEPDLSGYVDDGLEYAIFPMDYLQITQTSGEGTHECNQAVDLAGKDRDIDDFYAPFTLRIVRIQEGYNLVWAQSVAPVHLANGGLDYVTMLLEHSDTIDGLYMGKLIPQGEVFYSEGTAGNATGNHVHAEFALGRFTDIGSYHAEDGKVAINNGVAINEVLFLTESTQIVEDGEGGYTWQTLPISTQDLLEKGYHCQGQGHFAQERTEDSQPSCEQDGYFHFTCTLCGQNVASLIPATGHEPVESNRMAPAEGQIGSVQYTCSACSASWRELLFASADCAYADVADADAGYVAFVTQRGWLLPDDADFLPEGFVLRRDLASLLYESYGHSGYECDYDDVWDDDEDYDAIAWVTGTDMAGKTEGDRFSPDAPISRKDAIRMVGKLLSAQGVTLPEDWAAARGIVKFTEDLHTPLTRRECARLLANMAAMLED